MDEDPVELVRAAIVQLLDAAADRGFRFPFYLVTVTGDGVMMFFRYTPNNSENADEGLTTEKLAEYWGEFKVYRTPINTMLTDSTGQRALMRVRHPEGQSAPEFVWPDELPSD